MVVWSATTAVEVAADGPTAETILLNESDQTSVRVATLRRSDLGPKNGHSSRNAPIKPVVVAANGFVDDEAEIFATALNCPRIPAGRIQA
jgi:hypothetical protein